MPMNKFTGSPVPRYQVFTLVDGVFAVQWDSKYVQELLTGHYRAYEHQKDFGHPITDYELKQLKAAGRVEHFNRRYVWLYALPERGRFDLKVMDRANRVRTYYLSTTLSKRDLGGIQSLLDDIGVSEEFLARIRNDFVIILGRNGAPFRTVQEVERAQDKLQSRAPEAFQDLTIAFIESKMNSPQNQPYEENSVSYNLDEIIASQVDTSSLAGKRVVLAVTQDEEREVLGELFEDKMNLQIYAVSSGGEAINALEDTAPDLLVMDVKLADMHGWQLLGMMREIHSLRMLPVVAIMDEPQVVPLGNVKSVIRPVSMSRLRHTVWTLLNDDSKTPQ